MCLASGAAFLLAGPLSLWGVVSLGRVPRRGLSAVESAESAVVSEISRREVRGIASTRKDAIPYPLGDPVASSVREYI